MRYANDRGKQEDITYSTSSFGYRIGSASRASCHVEKSRKRASKDSSIQMPRSSSSSSQPAFRRLMTTLPVFSCGAATACRSSLSCSSVTFCRSWPVRASMTSRFSISVARDSFTIRILSRRSAASGCRIWLMMCFLAWTVGSQSADKHR